MADGGAGAARHPRARHGGPRDDAPSCATAARAINWIIWVAFAAEFVLRWAAEIAAQSFPRRAWFDLLLIVLTPPFGVPDAMQGIRSLRLLRLLRPDSRLWRRGDGSPSRAPSFRQAEVPLRPGDRVSDGLARRRGLSSRSSPARTARSAISAMPCGGRFPRWTTVGYGDITPVTPEGRLIAVVLMLTGIGVIGVFTATVASLLFKEEKAGSPEMTEILARLERIEKGLESMRNR